MPGVQVIMDEARWPSLVRAEAIFGPRDDYRGVKERPDEAKVVASPK